MRKSLTRGKVSEITFEYGDVDKVSHSKPNKKSPLTVLRSERRKVPVVYRKTQLCNYLCKLDVRLVQ